MRFVIVNPPVSGDIIFGKVKSVGNYQQPLGIAYIGAVLREAGHDVRIIDAEVLEMSFDDIILEIRRFNADVVGISSTTIAFNTALQLAKLIKDGMDVVIFLGGPHISAIPLDAMKHECFDIGILSEGEVAAVQVADALESGRSVHELHDINGILFRNNDGKLINNRMVKLIDNLDSLPLPARDLMPPLEVYKPTPASCKRTPLANMITSRGCPYQCTYCDKAVFGSRFRTRSPGKIVDEMEEVMHRYGAKEIKFWDDVINLNHQRLVEMCKEIVSRKLDIPWACIGRLNNINREQLQWMKKAGCWQISYGIESGNDQILKNIQKGITTALIRKNVGITAEEGISVRGFFMVGLPGETEQTMQDTINLAKSMPIDMASFYISTLFPNTEFYHQAIENGESYFSSWDDFTVVDPKKITYVPKTLTAEIVRKYHRKAHREFYFRPKYIARQILNLRSPEQIKWSFNAVRSILSM